MNLITKHLLRISRKAQGCVGDIVKKHGITSSEQPFVMAMYREDGITQEQLTKIVGLDKSQTSRAIASLERKALIVREKNNADMRSNRIYRTELLCEKVQAILPELTMFNQAIMMNISDEEKAMLETILQKLEVAVTAFDDKDNK